MGAELRSGRADQPPSRGRHADALSLSLSVFPWFFFLCVGQATHIFDGLESWPTHLSFFAGGEMKVSKRSEEFPELKEGRLVNLVAE